jgi:hypothetical protein
MNRREHLGVMIAGLLLVAMLYGFLRMRPARSQTALLSKNIQEAEARLAAMPSPEEPPGDPGKLEGELREIERDMTREQARLDALGKGFISLDDPTVLYRLQVELSEWARRCGMRILEESADSATARTDARPRRRLRAETSYAGFLKFLRGFKDRSGSVTLVEYTLEPAKIEDGVAQGRLEVAMTLAF